MYFLIPISVSISGKPLDLDKSHYILHKLTHHSMTRKNPSLYVNLYSQYLKETVGKNYRKIIEELKSQEIIQENSRFCQGRFSKSFRLHKKHWDKEITSVKSISAHLSRRIQIDNFERANRASKVKSSSRTNWSNIKKLQFNAKLAKAAYPNDEAIINWVSNGLTQYFSICGQGRQYHAIAGMNSHLRKFITLPNERLSICDFTHSQPSLHAILYGDSTPREKGDFVDLCRTGQLWKALNSELSSPYDLKIPWQKKQFKESAFKNLFYSSRNKRMNEYSFWFSGRFPALWSEMQKVKEGGTDKLPKMMMKIESEIVLDKVMSRDHFCVSIHDAILTTEKDAPVIKSRMEKAFFNKIGFLPTVETTILAN